MFAIEFIFVPRSALAHLTSSLISTLTSPGTSTSMRGASLSCNVIVDFATGVSCCFTACDGSQTRSFQYVDDLVAGLMALMDNEDEIGPVNIGNPGEFTMLELAEVVKEVVDKNAKIVYKENTADDPGRRQPDISLAKKALGWEPKITLKEGLPKMVEDFRERLSVAKTEL